MTILPPAPGPPEQPYEIDEDHVLEPVAAGEDGTSLVDQLLGEPPGPVLRDVRGRLWRVRSTQQPQVDRLLLLALGLGAVLLVVVLMALVGV